MSEVHLARALPAALLRRMLGFFLITGLFLPAVTASEPSLAGHEEDRDLRGGEHGQRQREPGVIVSLNPDNVPLTLLEFRGPREQRRRVPVFAQAQQHQIESRGAWAEDGRQLGFLAGGVAGRAVHRVDARIDVGEERFAGHTEVGVGMRSGNAAFVPEEDIDVPPGVFAAAQALVERAWRVPARERDGARMEIEEFLRSRLRDIGNDTKFGTHFSCQALGAMSASDSGGPQVAAG